MIKKEGKDAPCENVSCSERDEHDDKRPWLAERRHKDEPTYNECDEQRLAPSGEVANSVHVCEIAVANVSRGLTDSWIVGLLVSARDGLRGVELVAQLAPV